MMVQSNKNPDEILNNIREQFNLKNIPIRLKFKVGNNPYV